MGHSLERMRMIGLAVLLALKISWASAASAPSECADLNSQCSAWAAMGECVDNPVFMMENCAKSCCGMEFPCVKSHPPASADTDKRCKDTQKQCKEWANEGECVENPLFMAEECPQSCCGHCRVNGNDKVEGLPMRQVAVINSFLWAWKGYKDHAWGQDMLKPVSKKGMSWLGDLGLTLIDSLSTLIQMRESACRASAKGRYCTLLKEAEAAGKEWVQTKFTAQVNKGPSVNVFETTIRILGGLLSAYALTKEQVYLDGAKLTGDRLLPAFNSASGIPFADVNMKSGQSKNPTACLAEATTVQLEFKYLSYLTKDNKYWETVDKVNKVLQRNLKPEWDGLAPLWVETASGKFKGGEVSLGARGDSYYEYLLKQYIFTSKTEPHFWKNYETALDGIKKHLIKRTRNDGNGLTYVAEFSDNRQLKHKMDHLACFLPGMLALGAEASPPGYKGKAEDMQLAKELAHTCYQLYARSGSGLAPEIIQFVQGHPDFKVNGGYDSGNFLRPETVESLHVMESLTGEAKYADQNWNIFKRWEKHAFVGSGGYACLLNTQNKKPNHDDKMESFFISESLKYLSLTFETKSQATKEFFKTFVFNTEAHPLPIIPEKPKSVLVQI